MINTYADLHIHIGQSLDGKAVKITAAKTLTLPNIIHVARDIKGLFLIGVIDAHSTGVRQDFAVLLDEGVLKPLEGGGYLAGNLTVIPGTEIELEIGEGTAHFLAYFATLSHMERYIKRIKTYVKNWQLSSQKAYLHIEEWLEAVAAGEGIWLPAHAFTPHKGIYGNCCRRLQEVLPVLPPALEIGLSADRTMAAGISELDKVVLLSNSDAHSLPNIAREYNLLELEENSFAGFYNMVNRNLGQVLSNYGLPPQIGKYHRTYCLVCEQIVEEEAPQLNCPRCGSSHVVLGVLDRVQSIADRPILSERHHQYVYQVPLRELPGVGPKMYNRLLEAFATEMNVLHQAPEEELFKVAGEKVTRWILQARKGDLPVAAGGGGVFGRVLDILF